MKLVPSVLRRRELRLVKNVRVRLRSKKNPKMLARLFGISEPSGGKSRSKEEESSSSLLFDSKAASGCDKIMLCGPPESGKTSLLFELALSFADEEKHVLYICPKKVSKLPLLATGRTQPASGTLKYIQMVYLETKEEFLNYMASIHFSMSNVFNTIIVDDINVYFPATIKNEDLPIVAKIFALTVDAFLFQRSKQTNQSTGEQSGMLLMSVTVTTGTKTIPRQSFYERWVQSFLLVQVKEANLFELSVLPSNTRDGTSLANVVYRITDQSIIVEEVEYSSQSDGSSVE